MLKGDVQLQFMIPLRTEPQVKLVEYAVSGWDRAVAAEGNFRRADDYRY